MKLYKTKSVLVFRVETPCGIVNARQYFAETYYQHLQARLLAARGILLIMGTIIWTSVNLVNGTDNPYRNMWCWYPVIFILRVVWMCEQMVEQSVDGNVDGVIGLIGLY
jgi:hypothetical protein